MAILPILIAPDPRLKGKAEPLQIFEPLGDSENDRRESYMKALALYRGKSFAEASEIWDRLGDGPSKIMAERARVFLKNPPPDKWDGIWVMTTK